MTLGAWTPSTSLAGTTTQPSPSSSGGCGCGEGERGGSGAADDGAGSSIAADHARGRGVGGRRELRMGGRAGGGGKGARGLVVRSWGRSGEQEHECAVGCSFSGERRRLLSVGFGLAWLWPGLVGIVVGAFYLYAIIKD